MLPTAWCSTANARCWIWQKQINRNFQFNEKKKNNKKNQTKNQKEKWKKKQQNKLGKKVWKS